MLVASVEVKLPFKAISMLTVSNLDPSPRSMTTLFVRVAALAAIAVAAPVHAEPPGWRSVDALQLDVAGVRLGMGYDQALSAIAEHFKLSAAERTELKASTSTSYGPITKREQPATIRFTKDNNTIVVSFVERVPVGQGEAVAVSRVNLGIPSVSGNAAAMREAARAKYGEPSDARRKAVFHWCAHYNQIATCDPSKPKLSLVASSLSLSDPTLEKAAQAYLQSLSAAKPNI